MRNLIIQRMIDVNQRASHVQQVTFLQCALAAGNGLHNCALLLHHTAGAAQPQHTQGVANSIQRFGLRQQILHICAIAAQIQIQRVFDLQQVFLDRGRHGIQQRTVAPGQAAACMFDFGIAGRDQQAGQLVLQHRGSPVCGAQIVDQRQQHDRNVAMPTLQTLQIVRQLHQTAHQRSQGLIPIGRGRRLQCCCHLLHFHRHHGGCLQFKHAQGALHLVQIPHAGLHRIFTVGGVGERFELDPGLTQGLIDLGFYPTQRGMVDGVSLCRGHDEAPLNPSKTILP